MGLLVPGTNITLAIQRGNAASLLKTMPVGSNLKVFLFIDFLIVNF